MNCRRFEFEGHFPVSEPSVAEYNGIYCVLTGEVRQAKLLYVGIAPDQTIGERIRNHNKKNCWKRMAAHITKVKNPQLWFTTCKCHPEDCFKVLEAALIFKLQPPCNVEYRKNFSFPTMNATVCSPVSALNIPHLKVKSGAKNDTGKLICEEEHCYFGTPCGQ